MENLQYKSFQGSVRFNAEDRTFHGRVLGVDDVVNFEGSSVDELEAAFQAAVDDYIDLCQKMGRAPERSYSGQIPLRIGSDLHRRVALAAAAEDRSVNSWITEALEQCTQEPGGRVRRTVKKLRRKLEKGSSTHTGRARKKAARKRA